MIVNVWAGDVDGDLEVWDVGRRRLRGFCGRDLFWLDEQVNVFRAEDGIRDSPE